MSTGTRLVRLKNVFAPNPFQAGSKINSRPWVKLNFSANRLNLKMQLHQTPSPRRSNLLIVAPLIMMGAGIFLLILPAFWSSASSVPVDPVKDPAGFAQSVTETTTGLTSSIFIRLGGGVLLGFGIMFLIFGSMATMAGSILGSIFGTPGHGGFFGDIVKRIFPPKQPQAKICHGCGAKNEPSATRCKFCNNGL